MKVTEGRMNNTDEEFWVMLEAGSKDEVKHVGRMYIYIYVIRVRV